MYSIYIYIPHKPELHHYLQPLKQFPKTSYLVLTLLLPGMLAYEAAAFFYYYILLYIIIIIIIIIKLTVNCGFKLILALHTMGRADTTVLYIYK